LGLPGIGPADNFFDIGGHSLALVAVHERLAPHAPHGLDLVDLFRYPTVRALAAYLDGTTDSALDRAARRVAARRAARPTPKEQK
jgi:hypothetical protein